MVLLVMECKLMMGRVGKAWLGGSQLQEDAGPTRCFQQREGHTWAAYPRLETRKEADAESGQESACAGLRAQRKAGRNSRENSKEESQAGRLIRHEARRKVDVGG